MPVKLLVLLALVASLTVRDTAAASSAAALVFPIPAGACHTLRCQIDPYPSGSTAVEPAIIAEILPGATNRGLIQTQVLKEGDTAGTVLYSAYNADKSYLQTLWIAVMPSKGGYHVLLTTCPGSDIPPCKV